MISKVKLRLIFGVIIAMTFQSCSDFLKGKPAEQKFFEISNEDDVCIKEMTKNFKKMFRGESTESEITNAFQCLDQTLTRFQTRVEGRSSPDSFTAEELHIIFDKFHKDAAVSKQAAEDILILKKALLGGSENIITKTEIGSLKSYLLIIRQEVLKLTPYFKLYMFKKENGPFTSLMIEAGFNQLKSSLKLLLAESKLAKSEYEFEDLKKLLLNLNVVKDDEKDLLNLAEKVKDFLIGTDPLKNSVEYELAIDNFMELMTNSSQVLYGHIVFEILTEEQLNKVISFVERMVQLLSNSVQFQKNSQLQIAALDPLIVDVINKKILPFDVRSETFKDFYKKIIIRIFSDQKNSSIDSLDAIKKVHLQSIKKEIAVFKMYYEFINSNHFRSVSERQKISSIQARLKTFDVTKNVKVLAGFTNEEKKIIIDGFKDLRAEFLSKRPVIYRFKKMVIAENQDIWDVTWTDLTRGLYGQMMGRELLRGWGNSNVITESQLTDWYSDFKEFAIEIKAFDPRSEIVKTSQETFLQANLFTYSGNGDKEMSKTETFQYINMLTSGGNQTFSEIREGLKNAGCNLSEEDAFGYKWNEEACFYKDLKKNFKVYFSNLSYMVEYLGQLSDSEFKSFYDSVMVVARFDSKESGRIESADIRSLTMTMMYIESLYAMYDQNNNRSFSASEIRISYPRFTNFVAEYANKNAKAELEQWNSWLNVCNNNYPSPIFIQEAFIFMAYNGRLPKEADMNSPLSNFLTCWSSYSTYQPFTFKGEIDRKMIINTFKVLKSALESK